jgi:hypothetical protein
MFCGSLTELAKNLRAFSLSRIKDPGYTGVEIAVVNGNEIRVWDNDYANHLIRDRKPARRKGVKILSR